MIRESNEDCRNKKMEIDNNNIKEGLFNRLRESRNDLLRDNMRRVEHMNRNESILRIYW